MSIQYLLINNLDFNFDETEIYRIIEAKIGKNSLTRTMWLRNPDGQRKDEVLAFFHSYCDANTALQLLQGYKVGSTRWKVSLTKRTIEGEVKERLKIESIKYGMIF